MGIKVREVFKNIEKYKVLVMNYQDNMNYYYDCLKDDEKLIEYIERPSEEIMNVQKTRNITAPQEKVVIKKEIAVEQVKEEIEFYRARRNYLFAKLYILNKALNFLNKLDEETEYIIECRYLDRMKWSDIEISFNDKYRMNGNDIGFNMLNTKLVNGIKNMQEYVDSYPEYRVDYTEYLNRIKFSLK